MVIIRKLARYEPGLKSYQYKIKEQSYKYRPRGFVFKYLSIKEKQLQIFPTVT